MPSHNQIDYLEMPATGATLDRTKAFYSEAFGWAFTDYGPTYCAFDQGIEGGFQADAREAAPKPLPVIFALDLDRAAARVADAGGTVTRPVYAFPGGRRFHFTDPAGNELAVWSKA